MRGNMKISYAITICNEFDEILRLMGTLQKTVPTNSEIIILCDAPKASIQLQNLLRYWEDIGLIKLSEDKFENNFADWKNKLSNMCSGDYIFQIDADEIPNTSLLKNLSEMMEINIETDVILVPRINTVLGIQNSHLNMWGWNIPINDWINFPDYQWRIYRNNEKIKWVNKVHEKLEGFNTLKYLPPFEDFCLFHHKTIEKQISQNSFYYFLNDKTK